MGEGPLERGGQNDESDGKSYDDSVPVIRMKGQRGALEIEVEVLTKSNVTLTVQVEELTKSNQELKESNVVLTGKVEVLKVVIETMMTNNNLALKEIMKRLTAVETYSPLGSMVDLSVTTISSFEESRWI